MTLEDKVRAYKFLRMQVEELEAKRKALVKEILELLPKEVNALPVAEFNVRRMSRFLIKTTLDDARLLDAIKIEEVVDNARLKKLFEEGHEIPGVSKYHFIQVSMLKQ